MRNGDNSLRVEYSSFEKANGQRTFNLVWQTAVVWGMSATNARSDSVAGTLDDETRPDLRRRPG